MFLSLVLNTKTGKIIKTFFGNNKEEVELLARKELFKHDDSIYKNKGYKIFEMKKTAGRYHLDEL